MSRIDDCRDVEPTSRISSDGFLLFDNIKHISMPMAEYDGLSLGSSQERRAHRYRHAFSHIGRSLGKVIYFYQSRIAFSTNNAIL